MSVVAESEIREATREVATALLPELPSIGAGTAAYIEAAMPEVVQPGVVELVEASCHANSSTLLDSLLRGVSLDAIAPSSEVIQTTRALVRRGLTMSDVVRGYQLGATYWCTRWADAVEEHCSEPSLAVPTVSHGTTFLLGWLERVVDRLTAEYRDEAERMAREGSLARVADVRRALDDEDVDVDAVSRRLAYDLRARHVAIVLLDDHGDGRAPLEATARELVADVAKRPLVVRVDFETAWCWVPVRDGLALPTLRARVLVGQGRPGIGLEGFRRSHHEACEALRVARLAGRRARSITTYDHVQLAALCSGDMAACRAFVAEQLGPLGGDTDEACRLRATLEAFFDSNSNFRATAARLGIHHNTVRYRLEQIERLLDRPIGHQRLKLELALHLAGRVGAVGGVTS
jgi:PucR C-terminal helix-turn-helix domain/GGDEF-like domain